MIERAKTEIASEWISLTNNERHEVGHQMHMKYPKYWEWSGELLTETLGMALKDSLEEMFEMQKLMFDSLEEFRNSLWYY